MPHCIRCLLHRVRAIFARRPTGRHRAGRPNVMPSCAVPDVALQPDDPTVELRLPPWAALVRPYFVAHERRCRQRESLRMAAQTPAALVDVGASRPPALVQAVNW